MKIAYVKQTDLKDCGVSCLMSIVKYYGGYVRREYLRDITKTSELGVSVYSLVEVASKLGFESKALKGDITKFSNQTPFIAHTLINNKIGHFVVVVKVSNKYIMVMDPNQGFIKYKINEWQQITSNIYILYKPVSNIIKQEKEVSFWQLVFPLIKKLKKSIFLIIILSFLSTIISIVLSYGFKLFLDYQNNELKKILIILINMLIFKETINLLRNNLINYLNHYLDKSLITEVYNHIIKLPYLYFKTRNKGDIVTRIQDIFKIRDIVCKIFVTIAIDIIFVIIILLYLIKLNQRLTIIIIFITILYFIIITLFNNKIITKIKILKNKEGIVNNHLIESFSSIETIKSMQIENYLAKKFLDKYKDLQQYSFNINKLFNKENYYQELLINFGMLIIIYLGVISINYRWSLTSLLVYYSLLGYYFEPIKNISTIHLELMDSKVSFLRIKELLAVHDEKNDYTIKTNHLQGEFIIKNLVYSYNGINKTIECSNLKINARDKVLVSGNSGSGKSTFMKLIVAYLNNYRGEIILDGEELSNYNLFDIRNKITYVSQDEILYTDTIYNNITLKNNVSYQKYLKIIKLTGVSKIINKSILKDEMVLENNGSMLSGGEKQRVLLARALVKNSDVYIFDESFSALDIQSERTLLIKIFKYLKTKTIFIISHRNNNKDLYQKFITIDKGLILERKEIYEKFK